MKKLRPLGLTILGGLFTFLGGLTSFIIFIEMIDSVRFFGLGSVFIDSPAALAGFILYGGMPVLVYFTGVGIFTGSSWSRTVVLRVFPVLIFFLFFNIACNFARARSGMFGALVIDLMISHFDIFFNIFVRYVLMVGPLVFYFCHSDVRAYFEKSSD